MDNQIDKPYSPHSIGQHIVPFDLVFKRKDSVGHVLSKLRSQEKSWPNVEHIFVVDSERKFVGAVEFGKILHSHQNEELDKLITRDFPYVTDHAHQSNVAKIALVRGAENIPVIDQNGHFIGIVDATQILKILHEEHVEELMKFSGILSSEGFLDVFKARFVEIVKSRLPWLVFGLVGGMAATLIVERFEMELQKEIALAFFIPVIVYMNDAVGTQSETIFVRLASLEKVDLVKYLVKEAKVAVSIGLVLSSLISVFIIAWLADLKIAFIVGSAMFSGIISSIFIATLIPWYLQKKGKDPAIGSGPFTTIIQDLLSIVIYFSIASAIL